ncbi:MAG: tetratricopeptide repeat protein, partial [bacterium]
MTDVMTIQETFDTATRHHKAGRLDLAEKLYRHVLKDDPHNADALHSLGIIAHQKGKQKTAVDLLRRAISNNKHNPYFHNNIGLILAAHGRNDEAIKAFRIAVSMKLDYADAHYNLGCALKNQGLPDEAATSFTKALQLKPDFVEAWYNLGNAQQAESQFEAAIESYNHALRLKPSFEKAHNNLGLAFKAQGDSSSAIENYKKAIALNPNFAEAQWNLSLAELLCGNFIEGFKGYEWRFKKSDWKATYPFRYEVPCWDGSSFPGKKLFVHSEQGLGDTMQFVRYLPMVKAAGGTVLFETAKSLAGLFQNSAGIDKIVEPSSDGRMPEECDMYIPLLSLPRIFGTTLETIPADIPYVYADHDKADYWRGKLVHNDFRIGLVWAGKSTHHNDHNRSCPLEHFI